MSKEAAAGVVFWSVLALAIVIQLLTPTWQLFLAFAAAAALAALVWKINDGAERP
jgi:hypothetical protein